jgi:hypothetical protein
MTEEHWTSEEGLEETELEGTPEGPGGEGPSLGRWGAVAKDHYERFVPSRVAGMSEEERNSFYSELGRDMEEMVETYELALRGPDPEGEEFLARLGRFNMARLQAEERVRAEFLPAPGPEDDLDPDRPATPVMTDIEIICQHNIDLDPDDPERMADEQLRLQELRRDYKAMGLRPGLPD